MSHSPHGLRAALLAAAVFAAAVPAARAEESAEVLAPASRVLTLDAAPAASGGMHCMRPASFEKGLPLPVHSIEGVGGLAITPMAYLVDAGPKDAFFSYPAVSATYVNLGSKNLESFAVTETLMCRVELGFAAERFDLGNLPKNIRNATTVDIGTSDEWLFNFNARALLVEENSFDQKWLPAITAGVQVKYNNEISNINDKLGGALTGLGYDTNVGEDFTLTATKMLPKTLFDRPLILNAGLRVSNAANLGFLGFADSWTPTAEASVSYLATDWLLIAYEFRQKEDPYNTIPGLLNGEDNWHAIDAAWIINKHATLTGGYGIFGTLADSEANGAWWLQFKYEF